MVAHMEVSKLRRPGLEAYCGCGFRVFASDTGQNSGHAPYTLTLPIRSVDGGRVGFSQCWLFICLFSRLACGFFFGEGEGLAYGLGLGVGARPTLRNKSGPSAEDKEH